MWRETHRINEEQEEIRKTLQRILSKGINKLEEDLEQLDAGQRTKVLLQIAEYVLPKIERSNNRDAYRHTIHTEDMEDLPPPKRGRAA
jgi:hypothetical protein